MVSDSAVTQSPATTSPAAAPARVLLYSDDVATRAAVRRGVGRRAARDTPYIEWYEVATAEAFFNAVAEGGYALAIIDGETAKVGGFGLSRQIKDSYFDAPLTLLLTARPQDAWLAAWSQADGVVASPYAPEDLAAAVATLLRRASAS